MRKTILRRLEALEQEERSREQKELSSLRGALVYIWEIVLAYYLGGLKFDELSLEEGEARALRYPSSKLAEAWARALGYPSHNDYFEALYTMDISESHKRYNDAYRQLFGSVGLDFDSSPQHLLFDAFVTMVNQLPEQWLNWLSSNLQQWCRDTEIAPGSNLPRRVSSDNFLLHRKDQTLAWCPSGSGWKMKAA